jgi:hypothetical protein
MGVRDDGCFINWLAHAFCLIPALSQEARAIKAWHIEGRPGPIPGTIAM